MRFTMRNLCVRRRGIESVTHKEISGGQTGADRAALDFAISNGIPHGGSCPKGRRAEDGEIPVQYQLQELSTKSYLKRVEQNGIDSDGTVILTIAKTLKGASKKTAQFAQIPSHPDERV